MDPEYIRHGLKRWRAQQARGGQAPEHTQGLQTEERILGRVPLDEESASA